MPRFEVLLASTEDFGSLNLILLNLYSIINFPALLIALFVSRANIRTCISQVHKVGI